MTIPVVLTVYNRPAHTRRVIESLRPHAPQDVLVFCDGVKDGADADAVKATRAQLDAIDWTRPAIVVRSRNAGLAYSVVAAVDAALENYDSMILLEDDCVVGPHFFDFMHRCLDVYANDRRVMGVTGYTVPIPNDLRESYGSDVYFVARPGSWGWATWADRWQLYERDFALALARARRDGVDLAGGGRDIEPMIEAAIAKKLDAWTPGWCAAVARHGLFAYPTVSHVQNVGLDGTGVHCGATTRYDTPLATELEMPMLFPYEPFVDDSMLANFRRYYGG